MDEKLLECMLLIMSAFVMLTASSSEEPTVDKVADAACPTATVFNPVNTITINSCYNAEDDDQFKENIRNIKYTLSDFIARLENEEFCCDGSVEQVEEEVEEEVEDEVEGEGDENDLFRDCYEIQLSGETESGIYKIQPNGSSQFDVYCDMDTDSGGWTVFQRREDGSVDFYRDWEDYKSGFGSVGGEHWLGNDNIYYLSNQKSYQLRIDLADFRNATRYAIYEKFRIAAESDYYRLTLGDNTEGDAGNGMEGGGSIIGGFINGQQFSTHDADHDAYYSGNCAELYKGGWWYVSCHTANPNGLYLEGVHESYADGVEWQPWTGYWYSLKFTEMKLRPI